MASGGYYDSRQAQQPPYYDPQTSHYPRNNQAPSYQQPEHTGSNQPQPHPYAQPSFLDQPSMYGNQSRPQGDASYNNQHLQTPQKQGKSPFDSVFDDPSPGAHSPSGRSGDLSDQNTAYYGRGGGVSPAGDIPMQDYPGHPGMANDHIYDASGVPPGLSKKPTMADKLRLGELGMIGANKRRIPWVVYFFTLVQVGVFIGELVKNAILTGTPIMIKPQFNPMIGPSPGILINMGARYVPCMHNMKDIQGSTTPLYFACPNATANTQICPLSEVCGFGGVPNPIFDGDFHQNPAPNQWFRFITPIFMHAGLIHIGFNMLLQMTLAKEMEMAIGSIRFFLVYMSAGIFGFIMGGNFAAPLIASTGASGSLFGIIALTLLDLLYSWKERKNPVRELMFIILDVVIAFVLGLLPGLDNFSHIGGFLMGLALGICVLHSPNALRRRFVSGASYSAVQAGSSGENPSFFKSPIGFFRDRKGLWWAWWLVRAGALVGIIIVFIVLLNNFYVSQNTCSWCKYLSCLPINDWCEQGKIPAPSSSS